MRSTHPKLLAWVDEWTARPQPDAAEWTDGFTQEWKRLPKQLVAAGAFPQLDDSPYVVIDREAGADNHVGTPSGHLPTPESLELDGLDLTDELRDLDKRLSG